MRSPEMGKRPEQLDQEKITNRERGALEKFGKNTKARIAGVVLMAITSSVFVGAYQEAMAGEKRRRSAPIETVGEVGTRWQGQVEEIGDKYGTEVEQTHKNYSEGIERIMRGDFGTGTPMSEKFENWDRHSQAFRKFQEKYAGKMNVSGEIMARDFLEVIREFPNFRSSQPDQQTLKNEQNFKRIVNEYMKKRNEVNPNEDISYQRALLELQSLVFDMDKKNVEGNLGLSLVLGGGKQ